MAEVKLPNISNRETQLIGDILKALRRHYKGQLRIWRNNPNAFKTPQNGWLRFVYGSPDIFGILGPSGKLIGLEVIAPRAKVTSSQQSWQEQARALGAVVAVVCSVEEALATIQAALVPAPLFPRPTPGPTRPN